MSLNNVVFERKKILCLCWSTSAVSKYPKFLSLLLDPSKNRCSFLFAFKVLQKQKQNCSLCCSIFTSGFLGILFGALLCFSTSGCVILHKMP